MDRKSIEEQARATTAAGYHVGHVFVKHDDEGMHIKCTKCGAFEVAKGGEEPQKFVFQPTRMDGRGYVKCEPCGMVHDRVVPGAR